jgi:hypothetical protein
MCDTRSHSAAYLFLYKAKHGTQCSRLPTHFFFDFPSTHNCHGYSQVTDEKINRYADECRPGIFSFLEQPRKKEFKAKFREIYKNRYVRENITTPQKHWRENFTVAAEQLLKQYPRAARVINNAMEAHLTKSSRAQDILYAKAYQWLKQIQNKKLKGAPSWFLSHAIQVTFKAFRL